MPTDAAPASCFVRIIDQRVCELTTSLHTASSTWKLSIADVSVQPVLCRLSTTAALLRVDYTLQVFDEHRVHVASFAVSLAVVFEVLASCTDEQLRELACGGLLYHLHNELRVELDDWSRRMGLPRLVIEIMKPEQVRTAARAALA